MTIGSMARRRRVSVHAPPALGAALSRCSPSLAAPVIAADPFRDFLESLWPEAQAQGVSRATFDAAFRGLTPDYSLPDLIIAGRKRDDSAGQAEFTKSALEYLNPKYLGSLAVQGRKFLKEHEKDILNIEKNTGVDRYIMVAIWGRETAYGTHKLPHDAIRVLATQAFTGRRKDEFRARDHRRPEDAAGRRAARQDARLVGRRRRPDAVHADRIFQAPGRRRRRRQGRHLRLACPTRSARPRASSPTRAGCAACAGATRCACRRTAIARSRARPASAPSANGRSSASSAPAPSRSAPTRRTIRAYLMMPSGAYGPGFLATENFKVIRLYNTSDLYALFVGDLADRIAGAGGFHVPAAQVAQPRTAQVKEIQERLQKLGYPMDKIDGKIGSNTRRQVGTYQKTSGLKIDCWPTEATLSHLRSNAARAPQ